MESEHPIPKKTDVSETTENYLKRIYILAEENGSARVSDIAQLMDRSLSSVSEAVKRMAGEGLLNYEKYSGITLTDEGREIAESVHNNYSIMNDLLQTLGVAPKMAMQDACSMEHSISEQTVDTISRFVEFAKGNPEAKEIMSKFKSEIDN